MADRPEQASNFANPDQGRKTDPDTARGTRQPERSDVAAPAPSLDPEDRRMIDSGLSPNELDQTDESQNAADMTRAGAAKSNANP